jgi:hypothetical protein
MIPHNVYLKPGKPAADGTVNHLIIDPPGYLHYMNGGQPAYYRKGDPRVTPYGDKRPPRDAADDQVAAIALLDKKIADFQSKQAKAKVETEFSEAWETLAAEDLPEQKILATLKGEPLLREETLNEVFSFRGLGKSFFVASLIKALTLGDEFLGIRSPGGFRVLLVDGELPSRLLQKRLRSLVGRDSKGLLRVRSLKTVANRMPALADPAEQEKLIAALGTWRPDVIVFDTRTAVFKHDTNNQEQLMVVNEFLMELRSRGFAVILMHHAGKNGTQRGRTDNDDPLDLSIQLNPIKNGETGCVQFRMVFEKIRYGDRLEPFDAKWTPAQGWQRDTQDAKIVGLLLQGKTYKQITAELGADSKKILAVKRIAEKNGTAFPKNKSGRKGESDSDAG